VREGNVVEALPTVLVLETVAIESGPGPGTLRPHGEKTGLPGRLRIDLLSDTLFRVRYAEGSEAPENRTPMVVGNFEGPTESRVTVEDDRVVYTTGAARITVVQRPFSIRIDTLDRPRVCEIGGREKNQFAVWDSYNTGICYSGDGSPIAVECFALRPQEAIYGLGEQFLRLNRVGQTIDANMEEALGTGTPRSYKNVPFFMSTRGYGVFFNHSSRMTCWVGSMSAADVQVALEDDFLDYYLILGDPKQVLSQYTDITGKGRMPPRWSFGYWQSKISYRSADEALDVARRMRAAEVPMDVLHLDTHWFKQDWYCDLEFSRERFPDPRAFCRALADLGVRLSLWQLPYIPEGSRLFDDLAAVDGFVKDARGEIYDVGVCMVQGFTGRVGCIDFTNPEARRTHGEYLRRLFDLGASVIKVDFGEQAPLDGLYHDGTPGHRMHNLYPLLYNQSVAEATHEATGHSLIWARSAWAGSQRYPLHWGGDNSPNWHSMGPQFEGGLSLGLSGFQFWSQDIGGFIGTTGGELLVRWMQAGLFLSHARIHGLGDRELYRFDEQTFRICRDYIRLRYRLLPYIIGSAADCVARSLPMARALVIEYPDDPNVWNIGDQWLFGNALLVAPIYNPEGEREVYLPAGVWRNWWTGERLSGSRWLHVKADLETLPLYVREGAVVPMGPLMNHVDEFPVREVSLRIAPFEREGETSFLVPVNDEHVPVRYVADTAHRIEVGPSEASFTVEVLGEDGDVPA
jgi:alpha-D-xyloside xylohydrolase